MRFTVATWNLDHWKRSPEQRKAAWGRLSEIGADVALLQETVPPSDQTRDRLVWREIGRERRFGSAVSSAEWPLEEIITAKSCYSYLAFPLHNTFPGSVAIARARPPVGKPITFISLYGVIDVYSTATLFRQIADLIPLFDSVDGSRVILGGDLNAIEGTDDDEDERYRAIFAAFESLKLKNLFRHVEDRPAGYHTDGCTPEGCYHVGTHRNVGNRDAPARHLDYLFASPDLARQCRRVRIMDDEAIWDLSDHCPVLADFELDDRIELSAPDAWPDAYVSDVRDTLRAVLAEPRTWADVSWRPSTERPVVRTDRALTKWIAAFWDGTLADGSAASLELGIWRGGSTGTNTLSAHAGIWKGPDWARLAPERAPEPGVITAREQNRAYVKVPLAVGALPTTEARDALDTLLRALSRASQAR